jgi:hydroxymethylbilane synthase
MGDTIRIGTRDSQLATWQATLVSDLLVQQGYKTTLVYIKSEGDLNLTTPLYEIGVQGIFTRTLDIALLENRIDIAVHSMKDVPVVLARGLAQTAVLKRASYKDILVVKENAIEDGLQPYLEARAKQGELTVATSSIRRKAQWLYRYPNSRIENLRGNVNTRLRKLSESDWDGAIFAAAGLERIGLRPSHSYDLDWMLPAPAQGAIMISCRDGDEWIHNACANLHDDATAVCVKIEREFLRILEGGCSTPISGLATLQDGTLRFKGNITAVDGKESIDVLIEDELIAADSIASRAVEDIISKGAKKYMQH